MSKANVDARIVRYQSRRKRGQDTAVEHEVLYEEVKVAYGPMVADFFDKEHTLPYATAPRLPWPMKHYNANTFLQLRLILAVAGGLTAAAAVGYLDVTGLWFMAATVVIGAAVAYALVTVLPKLFRPRDIEYRERLVRTFHAMQREQSDAAEREATSRRDARLLRELEERE